MKIKRAEWLATAADPSGFPAPRVDEFAFLGRSNVGKSSLLNALVNRKQLARTSSAPGKTRLIHFYRVEGGDGELRLVDLPGYGYAKVSRTQRERWQVLVESYLEERSVLRTAVLLQDLRRDISEDETLLIEWLAERSVPVVLAITKCDKLKPMRRATRLRELRAQVPLAKERIVATSAEKRIGLHELWTAIVSVGKAPTSNGDPGP